MNFRHEQNFVLLGQRFSGPRAVKKLGGGGVRGVGGHAGAGAEEGGEGDFYHGLRLSVDRGSGVFMPERCARGGSGGRGGGAGGAGRGGAGWG